MEGISSEKVANRAYDSGIGYVVIPADVDRELYVKTCCRKERVDIQLDNGGSVIQNCVVSRSAIQEIVFPETFKSLGSCVAFVCDRFSNQPIVYAVLSKRGDSQVLEENSFKKVVNDTAGRVSIEGKAKGGSLFIDVSTEFDNGGNIFINLKSKSKTSKFNVKCFGDINLYAEGNAAIETMNDVSVTSSYIDGEYKKMASRVMITNDGFKYEDKNENSIEVKDETVNIKPKTRFNVFEGGSPMVLGDKLKAELEKATGRTDDLIQALKTSIALITVETAFSGSLTTLLGAITTKEDYSDINSSKSFTD